MKPEPEAGAPAGVTGTDGEADGKGVTTEGKSDTKAKKQIRKAHAVNSSLW
ncbi:MAG: hypothetical protein GQF41_4472 [Candidatus Rifleibacterium amylolyticum]|nr:MAG: hypothetical protein GQF41_4472 [Candidatus Rifleibacterium amylolyticum]